MFTLKKIFNVGCFDIFLLISEFSLVDGNKDNPYQNVANDKLAISCPELPIKKTRLLYFVRILKIY